MVQFVLSLLTSTQLINCSSSLGVNPMLPTSRSGYTMLVRTSYWSTARASTTTTGSLHWQHYQLTLWELIILRWASKPAIRYPIPIPCMMLIWWNNHDCSPQHNYYRGASSRAVWMLRYGYSTSSTNQSHRWLDTRKVACSLHSDQHISSCDSYTLSLHACHHTISPQEWYRSPGRLQRVLVLQIAIWSQAVGMVPPVYGTCSHLVVWWS